MVETVKRFRETGARVVLAISIGYIVVSLVRWGYLLTLHLGWAEASRMIGGSSLGVVMVLAIVASVLSCVLVKPATPDARRLVRAGAGVVALAALLELVFLALGLAARHQGGIIGATLEVVGGLLEFAVKAVAAYLLWRASSAAPEPAPRHQPEPAAQPAAVAPAAPPVQPASWSADQAAGAVWTRAGDAASGAAASTWGHPGQGSSGWNPVPSTPELAAGPSSSASTASLWPTAGQLASGEASLPAPEPGDEPRAGQVSWAPASRDE